MKESFLERRCGSCRVLTVIMLAVLAVIIVFAATLIATLTQGSAMTTHTMGSDEVSSDADCLDIAVIGGGIGGAYTGWRLRDRGLSISVFEYSDRVGGRLFTTDFPAATGTYLDFGGMRFRSGAHPTLNRTATEIGLNIIPFELGFGNPDETVWFSRGKRMVINDIQTNDVPYNLKDNEKKDPGTLLWNIFNNNVNFSGNTYPSLDEMYSLTTSDGTPLYKVSVDNLLGSAASHEAYDYISDLNGWDMAVGRMAAPHSAKFFIPFPGNTGISEGYKTIDGGMQKVPQTLMKKFLEASSRHKLHLNHHLVKIEKRQAGGYNLGFRKTQTTDGITTPVQTGDGDVTMCARKVVLAAQQSCIQEIDFPAFKTPEIMQNLDSLIGMKSGRIYLAYNTKWWKTGNPDITHTKSDLPNRQTYDWSTGTNNVSIIMASYHDGDLAHYWRELSQFGTPIPGSLPGVNAVTDVVKKRAEKYLSAIYNVSQSDIPEAVGGAMMLWDKYPFNYGWNLFKPGADERKVREVIPKPSPSDDVYIVSNSWAPDDLQGWSEGVLRAVDGVINKYFKNM
ncbi:aplysianin-A-like [Haliotis rufescens]|uniref:aplysianin-A-like n=1 Tax=Haliotis rufescens TaxID=6454 RepID=UPI00201EB9FC|nr:aplysianin-A-like [Haliotis rufescens]